MTSPPPYGSPYGGYPSGGYPYAGYPYGGYPYAGYPYGGYPYGGYPYGGYPYGGYPYGWPGYGWPGYGSPPPLPPHEAPRSFTHVMRSRTWAWWRPLLGLLLFAGVYLVASVLAGGVVLIALLPTGRGWVRGLADQNLVDPRVLLVANASLVVAIPVLWLVWAVVHRMGIGWSSSVLGRLRWRLFLPWGLLAAGCLGLAIGLSVLVGLGSGEVGGNATPLFGWLLLVVLLTTPLQSAAEEYLFRGYLSQAVAGWFRSERTGAAVAALGTATLFSLAHLPPDWPTFLDRFAVGLTASTVVWLTGGLEAAISLHAVNNVLVFLLAAAFGGGQLEPAGPGEGVVDLLLTVLALAGYGVLVAVLRRRVGPETRTPATPAPPAPPAPPWPFWTAPLGPRGHGGPGGWAPSGEGSGIVSPWRREAGSGAPEQSGSSASHRGAPNGPWGMG